MKNIIYGMLRLFIGMLILTFNVQTVGITLGNPIFTVKGTWCNFDGSANDPFEMFGPRAERLLIKFYVDKNAEWEALSNGEIDLTCSPLDKTHYELFKYGIDPITGLPYNETINTISSYLSRIYILDINNNNNPFLGNPPNPDYPNPVYPNPTSVKELRQAIAYLVNRSWLAEIIGEGLYTPLYTVVPPSMGSYSHAEISSGGALENLTYSYSRSAAVNKLNEGGFPLNQSTGWRFWDRNRNGLEEVDEQLELKFYIQVDDPKRKEFGLLLANELEAVGIRVNKILEYTWDCFLKVKQEKDFHLYIGAWSLSGYPDHLIIWNWDNYEYPGFCFNYAGINNEAFNNYSNIVVHSTTFDEAKTFAWLAQEVFALEALSVPLWSPCDNNAMNRFYTGGNKWQIVTPDDGENAYRGRYWDGTVNRINYGIVNKFSFLNMHPRDFERGNNITIRLGCFLPLSKLNPLYPEMLVDHLILEQIYESLLTRDPADPTKLIPWLAESFEFNTYFDRLSGEDYTKAKFTLRSDVAWADGTPLTTADVHFTLVELPSILKQRGLPSPYWWPDPTLSLSLKIFDPYNFEVLLNTKSIFLAAEAGEILILPKHVWKPVVENGDPTAFVPDPNMIGSGPWRLAEYVEGSHILLVAHKPDSTVQTNLPGSSAVTSPQGYFGYDPLTSEIRIDESTKAKINRDEQPHIVEYIIYNLYLNGSITLDINITCPDGTIYTRTNATITCGGNFSYSWTGEIKGKTATCIRIRILEPEIFATTHVHTKIIWSTIVQDISGSYYIDPLLRAPDIAVDIKDIALACKAFGSYPGHSGWGSWGLFADINNDYLIDIKDVFMIAKKFGWG